MSESPAILPCPYCGASGATSDEFRGYEPFEWRFICSNKACEAWGPEKQTREAALDAWNARQPLALIEAGPERLGKKELKS